jgi:PEP-CTERM motif-containing protein
MRLRRVMVFLVAFWVIGALNATNADAQFRLRIEDLNSYDAATNKINAVVITDDMLGDQIPGLGAMQFNLFGMAGVDASLTISWSKPIVTGPSNALQSLFLNSVTMNSSGPANIRLTLEDTGYENGTGSFQLTSHIIDGAFFETDPVAGAAAGSTVSIQSWVNTSNTPPDLGLNSVDPTTLTAMDALGPNVGTGTVPAQVLNLNDDFMTSPDATVGFNAVGPYSLWTQVTFNLTGGAQVNFNQDAFVTPGNGETLPPDGSPEPTSLILISTGLFGLAGARRRQILGMIGRG